MKSLQERDQFPGNPPALTTPFDQIQPLSQIAGDSFYLADSEKFETNWRAFQNAFQAVYPQTQLAYSYKTNYLPAFCNIVNRIGGLAEVVSGLEYSIARQLGVDPSKIIFNGPYKTESELKESCAAGSTINIDHAEEARQVLALADQAVRFRACVRINLMDPQFGDSRFGFPINDPDTLHLLETLQQHENIQLCGLHVHYCPPVRSAEVYASMARQVIDFARTVFPDSLPEMLNLGGGFFSPMSDDLKKRWDYPVPDYDDYALAIGSEFSTAYGSDGPRLILEPGMAVVADTMRFVSTVIGLKSIGGQSYGLLSGSVYNIKPTKNSANLPIEVVSSNSPAEVNDKRVILTGYTCMEDDIMHTDSPPVCIGDFVIFDNVGAYTTVLTPPFIQGAPAILEPVTGQVIVHRRAQSTADILQNYATDS